jgi:hypothetical protein
MPVTPTDKKSYFSIRRVLFWLLASFLVYPICLSVLSVWDYLIGDGELAFTQLHHFLYTFEYGSKRQALSNLMQLGLGCLWAGLISLAIVVLLHLLNHILLRNASPVTKRKAGAMVLLSAAFALLVSPGIIGSLVLIAVLLAISTSRIMGPLE